MGSLPELEAWAIFARVAETGSFARAAATTGLSTATVSKAVARLERRSGGALLNRTSRRLSLTGLGRALAERALALLDSAEALEAEARDRTLAPQGLVRIAAPMSFGQQRVAPLLPELMQAHPGLEIDLHLADGLVDLIGEGFDFALRIGTLRPSSLRVRHLCDIAMHVVAAPAYLAAHGAPEHPRALPAHACFAYAYARTANRLAFTHAATGETAAAAVSGRLRVNNGEAAMPALLAGLGIAALPDFLVDTALAEGRLVAVLPDWVLPSAGLNLVMPPGRLRPARIEAAIGFFARRLVPDATRATP